MFGKMVSAPLFGSSTISARVPQFPLEFQPIVRPSYCSGSLDKLPLKLEHGWVFACNSLVWPCLKTPYMTAACIWQNKRISIEIHKFFCFVNTVDSRYLALVGSQNSRARVKWLSRAVARRRRLANSGSPYPHSQAFTTLKHWNSMLSDNRGTYVSRISTHIDIAPATNHNKQHYILIIKQQNCQITHCARQHTMDSVLKSAKLRRDLTGNRNGFTHARQALCGRVSPKLDGRLGDKFANRISNN